MSERKHEVHENEEDLGESEQGDLPVVLQCSQCNVILGDSMSWSATNDALKSITLHSVSSMVVKGKQLVTSTEGIDLGSTYQQLHCKSCKDVVGRIYTTTPRPLDDLRDLYTLSITKINSYQVGSAEQTSGVHNVLDIASAKELHASITKTQVMVCTLSERVMNIEKAMEMEGENEDEEETEIKRKNDKILQITDSERDGSADGETYEQKSSHRDGGRPVKGRRMLDQHGEETNNNDNDDVVMNSGKRGKERDGKNERNSKRTKMK